MTPIHTDLILAGCRALAVSALALAGGAALLRGVREREGR